MKRMRMSFATGSNLARFCAVFLLFSEAAAAKDFALSKDGAALVPIVVPDSPTRAEEYAAQELKEHLDKITGGSFEIAKFSAADKSKPAVYVGDTPKARSLFGDPEKFEFDAIKIKTTPDALAIVGHKKRGTIFAVETFLEDTLGVRWWTAGESRIPHSPTLAVPEQNTDYAPALKHRVLDYIPAWRAPRFTARCRAGSLIFDDKTLQRQTNNGFAIGYHSAYHILPPAKYFDKHPEWYSEIGGRRVHKVKGNQLAQLCLTNAEMRAEFIKVVLDKIRKRPDSEFAHISQNDYYNYCECKNCADFVKAHGGEQSALIIDWANAVAEAVEGEFPNVKIVTFAYQYGRRAPKNIKPRHNVWVELCTIECDFAHPLESDTDYGFTPDIKEWSKLTRNLTIWNYVTNFKNHLYPYPNFNCFKPDIEFFVRNGAIGLFEQADAYCNVGDMVRLRYWVLSHLMWNPSLDTKKLVREFLHGYYTPEVGAIFEEYIWLINDRAFNTKYAQSIGFDDILAWMDIDTFIRAAALMEDALDKAVELEAKDPEKYRGLASKVRRDRTSFDWFALMNYANAQMLAEREGRKIARMRDIEYTAEKMIKVFEQNRTTGMIPNYDRAKFEKSWYRIRKAAANQKEYVKKAKRNFVPADILTAFPAESFREFQDDHFMQSSPRDRRIHIPVEFVADPLASNGFASKLYDGDTFTMPYRDYLIKLKSASGKKSAARTYTIYAYISTKGAKNAFKTIYDKKWRDIKTGGDYMLVNIGKFGYTPESLARKHAVCHKLTITPKDPKNFLLDRIVIVEN